MNNNRDFENILTRTEVTERLENGKLTVDNVSLATEILIKVSTSFCSLV